MSACPFEPGSNWASGNAETSYLPFFFNPSSSQTAIHHTRKQVGAAKVKEAERVRKQQEQVRQRLDAAAELERQRRAATEQ